MGRGKRYARTTPGVKGQRGSIERLIDAVGWRWDRGLSLLLDAAIIDEETTA